MSDVQTQTQVTWPKRVSSLKKSRSQQLSFGAIWFRRAAICDEALQQRLANPQADLPVAEFDEGDTAHVFYEFIVEETLVTPFPGLEITDKAGKTVHGKLGPQAGLKPPRTVEAGTILRYHQTIKLNLPPGVYALSLACYSRGRVEDSSESPTAPRRRQSENAVRNIAALEIKRSKPAEFAGGMDLPGSLDASYERKSRLDLMDMLSQRRPRSQQESADSPAVFHITHHKAGSTWISRILHEALPGHVVPAVVRNYQVLHWPVAPGAVYPQTYLDKRSFDALDLPREVRTFVVIRDLRDALISAYFSFKGSHRVIDPGMMANRKKLEDESFEDGIKRLMDTAVQRFAAIQLSWIEAGARIIKYEDLLENDLEILTDTLLGHCELPISTDRLTEVILQHRFDRMTRGRRRGEEDASHHLRKGVSGDWRNHFSDEIKQAFKNRFGSVLIAAGYEETLDW